MVADRYYYKEVTPDYKKHKKETRDMINEMLAKHLGGKEEEREKNQEVEGPELSVLHGGVEIPFNNGNKIDLDTERKQPQPKPAVKDQEPPVIRDTWQDGVKTKQKPTETTRLLGGRGGSDTGGRY